MQIWLATVHFYEYILLFYETDLCHFIKKCLHKIGDGSTDHLAIC
jgi:hypothetical protein